MDRDEAWCLDPCACTQPPIWTPTARWDLSTTSAESDFESRCVFDLGRELARWIVSRWFWPVLHRNWATTFQSRRTRGLASPVNQLIRASRPTPLDLRQSTNRCRQTTPAATETDTARTAWASDRQSAAADAAQSDIRRWTESTFRPGTRRQSCRTSRDPGTWSRFRTCTRLQRRKKRRAEPLKSNEQLETRRARLPPLNRRTLETDSARWPESKWRRRG